MTTQAYFYRIPFVRIPEDGKYVIVPGSYLKTDAQINDERQWQANSAINAEINRRRMVEAMQDVCRPYYEALSAAGYIINKRGQARRQVPRVWHRTTSWTFADEKGAYRMTLDFHPQRPFLREDSIVPDKARIDFHHCFGYRKLLKHDSYGKVTGTIDSDLPRVVRLELGFADQNVRWLKFVGQDMYPEHLAVFQSGTDLEKFAKRFCYTAEKRTNSWWGEEEGRWSFEARLGDIPVFKLGQDSQRQWGFCSTRFFYDSGDDHGYRKECWAGDLSYYKSDGASSETLISGKEMVAVVKSTLGLIPLETV